MSRSLVSVDVVCNDAAHAAKVLGTLSAYGTARIAKTSPSFGGLKVNFDIILAKGAALPASVSGLKFNSARRYKYNNDTFFNAGLKVSTKTVTTIG